MNRSLACGLLLVLLAALSGCCASLSQPQRRARAHEQRAILNEGYSMLYSDITKVARFDLVFLVKVEADTVEQLAREVSDYAGSLREALEKAAADYPAVDIELEPLPEMEARVRARMIRSSIMALAPVVGLTGASFERRSLQSLEGALNHLQALCEVMAEAEPEPGLKRLLTEAQGELERRYDRILEMLRERYYINTGEQKAGN